MIRKYEAFLSEPGVFSWKLRAAYFSLIEHIKRPWHVLVPVLLKDNYEISAEQKQKVYEL